MLYVAGFLMILLLRFLLGLLLLILVILLLVLLIPFQYRLSGQRYEEEADVKGSADWLFGLVSMVFSYDNVYGLRLRLMLFSRWVIKSFDLTKDEERSVKGIERAKKKAEKLEARNKKLELKRSMAKTSTKNTEEKQLNQQSKVKFILTREKLFILIHTVIQVLKKVTPQHFFLHCRIGFDDPADTGTFCAILAPMQVIFRGNPKIFDIRIIPVFEDTEVSGRIDIQGHIIIWFIVWEALKLAISRPFRQDIFHFMKPHKTLTQGGYEHV